MGEATRESEKKQKDPSGFSLKGQFTLLGHISGGGGRPLLREGAPISYQPRPEATSPPSPVRARR